MKAVLRATTDSAETLERSVMMSSLIPSLKYSCSGSPLMLANGRTQMESRPRRGGLGRRFACRLGQVRPAGALLSGLALGLAQEGPHAAAHRRENNPADDHQGGKRRQQLFVPGQPTQECLELAHVLTARPARLTLCARAYLA